jgi:hypothetical protein
VRRLSTLAITALFSLILIAIPVASACQGCNACIHTIQVIPVGSQKTGEPIVTGNPADLMIFHTGQGPIKNVWLLIVINEQTYNTLENIIIDDSIFMTQSDFQKVVDQKIPPINPSGGYPGSLCQYEVSAVSSKLKETGDIYYGVKFFLDEITNSAHYFTLTIKLNGNADLKADLKALILALGVYGPTITWRCFSGKFNACSSFSKSTFVIPETSTIALTSASLCGVAGFYLVRRRKKL